MATLRLDKASSDTDPANAPAQANKWAVTRAARRLADSPASLYRWLSGPPLTQLERERATLADARNLRGRGTLIV